MGIKKIFITLLLFVLSTSFSLAITDYDAYLEIKNTQGENKLNITALVYRVEGECFIEETPQQYEPVTNKGPLNIGQKIKTDKGKMIILIKVGSEPIGAVTLDQHTTLQIVSTSRNTIYVNLSQGSGRFYISSLDPFFFSVIMEENEHTQIITGQKNNGDYVVNLANDQTAIYQLLENVELSHVNSDKTITIFTPTEKKFILEDTLDVQEMNTMDENEIWWENPFYAAVLPEFTRRIGTISNTAFIIACLVFGLLLFASIFKTKKEMALKKKADAPYVIDEKKKK